MNKPDYDPTTDPLLDQVCRAEDRDVLRDPEADAEPMITRVESGKQAEPRPVDPDPTQTEGKYR